jgi:hypothetical protein
MKVFCTVGNFPRRTPVRDLHTTFNIPYVSDYITKLCRQIAEVIQNHENELVRSGLQAAPQLKWLVAGFPQRLPGSTPGLVIWDLWWTKWHLGLFVPPKYFGFLCRSSFQQLLHSHHHLSSGTGTEGQ